MSLKVIVLFKVTFSVRLLLKDMEYVFIIKVSSSTNFKPTFYVLLSSVRKLYLVYCEVQCTLINPDH